MAQYVTKNQLGDFTEKLLSNDKKIRDELKQEISNLPSGGGLGSSYTLPTASTTTLGGVKVDGTTITVGSGGVISSKQYTLPTASETTLGGVKVDNDTITVNSEGVISATKELPIGGTTGQMLVKKSGTNYDVEWKDAPQGGAAVDVATTDKAGIVKPDGTSTTVDADGTIHANAQVSTDEIKTQIETYMTKNPVSATVGDGSILKKHLSDELLLDVIGFGLTIDLLEFKPGAYASNDSYVSAWTNMQHTDLIDLEIFKLVKFNAQGFVNRPIVLFYDENKQQLKTNGYYNAKNSTTKTTLDEITIPDDAKYIRCQIQTSGAANSEITFSCKQTAMQSFDKGEYYTTEVVMSVGDFPNAGTYSNYNNETYKTVFKANDSMLTSDLLKVNFSKMAFKTKMFINNPVVTYFDSEKEAVGCTIGTANAVGMVESVAPTNACYYAITVDKTTITGGDLTIIKRLSKYKIEDLIDKVLDNENKHKNFLDYSKYQFMQYVLGKDIKVLCLGDSLTYGACAGNSTVTSGSTHADNPYGKFIADMTGWDVTINGYGGARTTHVWNTLKAGKPSNWGDKVFDIIIVFLGTNYGTGASSQTNPLNNIPEIPTDAPYDDNTAYDKCYMNILWQLNQWYPNATIFCVNIPKYINEVGLNYRYENTRLEAIVEKFGYPLLDIRNYYLASLKYDDTLRVSDKVHWNNLGYAMVGEFFKNEILKYFYENPGKYKIESN